MNLKNYKKINFLLFLFVFSNSTIAEFINEVNEENNEVMPTRGCCNYIQGPRGDRGPTGNSTFPAAYGYFYADPVQTALTPSTPLDFTNTASQPQRLQLTPPNEAGQSTGVIIEDTGIYLIFYKASFIVDQNFTETVASIAITIQEGGQGPTTIIPSSEISVINPAGFVFSGDSVIASNSFILNLTSGDIIGLECPGIKNISSTGLAAQPVIFNIQRIG